MRIPDADHSSVAQASAASKRDGAKESVSWLSKQLNDQFCIHDPEFFSQLFPLIDDREGDTTTGF